MFLLAPTIAVETPVKDPMPSSNEMIIAAGSAIVQDAEYRSDPSWETIAIVYNFLNGRQNSYGYIFRADGSWKASLPQDDDDVILDTMLDLQAAMERETGKKWMRALVHITRVDQGMNILFEYDDPQKWAIDPGDLEKSVAALKP